MDTDTSKNRSPTSKKTPRAKPRQAPSRDKPATASSPFSSSIKKRERTRRKPAPKPVAPPKKKVRVVKYYIYAPKNPRANTELPEHHDGAWGAVFNPYGLKQPKFLLPEYSSLGHSTANTSSVSVLQQASGYQAAPSASGRRKSSSPLFIERAKPMVIKKSKANGGIKSASSKTKARASSASPPNTTKKARNATTYPAANGSAGSSTNKAIGKHAGGSKNTTYMENFARSKASAATTQDTAAANGHKQRRSSVSTKRGRSASSASRASASAQDDDSSQLKTSMPYTPLRKQRAAVAPMTSAATIKAYSATPAKRRSRSRSLSRSRSASASASSTAKTTQDDDGEEEERPKKKLKKDIDTRTTTQAKRKADSTSDLPRNTFMYSSTPTQSDDGGNGAEQQPPKKKLKKKIDTRTTKAKRKAGGSTSNLPNKFMYSSSPTQSDGDTPQSKRVRKDSGVGCGDSAFSASPTAGKGKKDKARSSATTPVDGYDGANGDRDEELRGVLFSSSPTVQG